MRADRRSVQVTGARVRLVKVVAAVLGVVVASTMVFSASAGAQIPDLPDLPQLPPEAQEAIRTLEDALIPVLVDVASELQVVSNAAGFALRPGCSLAGTAVILLTLLGGSAPVSLGYVATPVLMFCAGAFTDGPVDPLFAEVDELVGGEVQQVLDPVYEAPGTVCGVLDLVNLGPDTLPPPVHRLDLMRLLCA